MRYECNTCTLRFFDRAIAALEFVESVDLAWSAGVKPGIKALVKAALAEKKPLTQEVVNARAKGIACSDVCLAGFNFLCHRPAGATGARGGCGNAFEGGIG